MSTTDTLLDARNISYRYGAITAVNDVNIGVGQGEAVCVIGPNGAGKTTLSRVLGGLYRPLRGEVRFAGKALPRKPFEAIKSGVASVLEGRHLFVEQSVRVNLELGCYRSGLRKNEIDERVEEVMALFPALRTRSNQRTSTMSGGEQQMVAIGRALMSKPRLLILDEPSMGLSPKISGEVFDALGSLRQTGLSILLIEQNAPLAFELATRGYLMRQGSIVLTADVDELADNDAVRSAYLGA